MLKHIVMWRFKDEAGGRTKEENIEKFKSLLTGLVGVIDQIVTLEVGVNVIGADTASDVVLYSQFASIADLEAYSAHPEHQKVLAFGKEVIAERRAVDYEV